MEEAEADGRQGEEETAAGEDEVKTALIVALIVAGAGGWGADCCAGCGFVVIVAGGRGCCAVCGFISVGGWGC